MCFPLCVLPSFKIQLAILASPCLSLHQLQRDRAPSLTVSLTDWLCASVLILLLATLSQHSPQGSRDVNTMWTVVKAAHFPASLLIQRGAPTCAPPPPTARRVRPWAVWFPCIFQSKVGGHIICVCGGQRGTGKITEGVCCWLGTPISPPIPLSGTQPYPRPLK